MSYNIEVTDTFGGEANYCWVKRGKIEGTPSRRKMIAEVKKLAGWDGWCRVKLEHLGDCTVVRPVNTSGVCQIAFVTAEY